MTEALMPGNAQPKTSVRMPTHLRWVDYRRELDWNQPNSDKWGSHRGRYPGVATEQMTTYLARVPAGQSSPREAVDTSRVIFGISGSVDFEVDQDYRVGPCDVLRLDPSLEHRYVNRGLSDALFFVIEARPLIQTASSHQPVFYLQWAGEGSRLTWTRPRADQWGSHRGVAPDVLWAGWEGHTVVQPTGQSAPWHAAPGDVVHIHVQGDLEYTCAGRVWPQQPMDVFLRPAGTPYIYTNVGLTDAIFFVLAAKVPGSRPVYWDSDPGWPARSDAAPLPAAGRSGGTP